MSGDHKSLSSGPVEVSKPLWLEGLTLKSNYFQGRTSDNISRGCRRVLSPWLQLEEPMKRRETPIHLHVHSVGVVHGWCKSFWTSLRCWWLHCDRASRLHVRLHTPREPDWWWVLNHRMLLDNRCQSLLQVAFWLTERCIPQHYWNPANENVQQTT